MAVSGKFSGMLSIFKGYASTIRVQNYAKAAATATTRKQGKRRLMRNDGDYVTSGTLLATQRPRFFFDDDHPDLANRSLRFHPGQYAGIGRNHTIYALESGRTVITAELFHPKWESPIVSKQYAGRQNQRILRHYLHVIPDPLPKTFKLVDEN
ncbi:large ribosomal subunit protein bL27m-like [Artemia franciscana]|uniref:large ribosomal subunit protein bL27m-like n=1 Tax=Artemia franciscana TaxID=6661 RepID=UPI0032DB8745